MANRFPLVLDTTDNNKIKEIQSGDNLNLADNSIVGVQNITAIGTIDAADIRVAGNRLVAQNFADLIDTPSSFIGSQNYFVKVKADGTGLEYRSLSDLGNIEIDTITVDTSIVPSVGQTGNIGTDAARFDAVYATSLYGNLRGFNDEIVFNASTAKISYAALQGAPTFLSEFANDVGYLRTIDLDTQLAGLFDDGQQFVTDVQGSVFGDDSTLLVDAVASIITGNVLNSEIVTTELIATTAQITTSTATSINGPITGDLAINAGVSGIINIGTGASTTTVNIENAVFETFDQGTGLGTAQLTADTDLVITAGNRVKIDGGVPFRFASVDVGEQLVIGAQEGDVIYNTTTSRLQMYQNAEWKDINGNVEATTGTSNFNDIVVAGDLTGNVTGDLTGNVTGDLTGNVTGDLTGNLLSNEDITLTINNQDLSTYVWTFGGDGNLKAADGDPLQILTTGASGSTSMGWSSSISNPENIALVIANSPGSQNSGTVAIVTGSPAEANIWQFGASGNLTFPNGTVQSTAYTGYHTGDVTGSVFADDSSLLVNGVNGTVPGTLTGNWNNLGNIFNITGSGLSVSTPSSALSFSTTGFSAAFSNGTDNSAYGFVDTGASLAFSDGANALALSIAPDTFSLVTTGNITISSVGDLSITSNNFTLNSNGITADVTGDVTGNIDNTTLTIGATVATAIAIGNSGSTTTINGIVSLPALIAGSITADNSISITTAAGNGNAISIGPDGTNTFVNLTADNIRFFGPITTTINATGGVIGNLKGSVVADDSTVMIDGQNGTIVGPVVSADISSTLVKVTTIENYTTDDLAINVDGFFNISAGTDDVGLSKIQMDQAGINYIELTTEPINPSNPADVANIAINATSAAGDVVIGTTSSSRSQAVTIHNATVNGTLVGSAQGNHTGTLAGDVVGSVFADDSAPMVDAVNYALFSDTLSLTPLNAEPVNLVNGMIAVADGVGWDPASNARNTLVAYLGGAWVTVAAAA